MTLQSGANSQQSTPAARALFNSSPEEIATLRIAVRDWLKRGRKGLVSFAKNNGTFYLDSVSARDKSDKFNTTTTSRSFTGLIAANWRTPDPIERKQLLEELSKFVSLQAYSVETNGTPFAMSKALRNEERQLNNFDVAHLSDYIFALQYANRFFPKRAFDFKFFDNRSQSLAEVTGSIRDFIRGLFLDNKEQQLEGGEIRLDPDEPASRHFFVTLHSLRALAITSNMTFDEEIIAAIAGITNEHCKTFCTLQCFYAQRKDRHEFDATNLVFALTTYAMHDQNIDKDLCTASLEAIRGAQQSSGSWPATHPIMRPKGKPWHITSHEIALCMTWLYFQPKINDQARAILLEMMDQYFRNWVVKTHVMVEGHSGWFDDHTRTRNIVSGWATAIVCHFLANYEFVLSDHLNRRVIRSLGIDETSHRFLIDEDAHKRSGRWEQKGKWTPPTWPDLPPISWSKDAPDEKKKLLKASSRNGATPILACLVPRFRIDWRGVCSSMCFRTR